MVCRKIQFYVLYSLILTVISELTNISTGSSIIILKKPIQWKMSFTFEFENHNWCIYDDASLKTSTKETLLGILLDWRLSFDQHVSSICSKASKNLHGLKNIATFISFEKSRTLLKAFTESQFNCPLIWMFHSRIMNNKFNRIHEGALRLDYSDHVSFLTNYLKMTNQFLFTTETIKVCLLKFRSFFSLSPSIMKNLFHLNTNIPYKLRSCYELYCRNPTTVKYGTETKS